MSTTTTHSPYIPVRDDWLARRSEAILEPALPTYRRHTTAQRALDRMSARLWISVKRARARSRWAASRSSTVASPAD